MKYFRISISCGIICPQAIQSKALNAPGKAGQSILHSKILMRSCYTINSKCWYYQHLLG